MNLIKYFKYFWKENKNGFYYSSIGIVLGCLFIYAANGSSLIYSISIGLSSLFIITNVVGLLIYDKKEIYI